MRREREERERIMKKKVIAMVMATAMIATMAGCGSKGNSGSGIHLILCAPYLQRYI